MISDQKLQNSVKHKMKHWLKSKKDFLTKSSKVAIFQITKKSQVWGYKKNTVKTKNMNTLEFQILETSSLDP